MHYHPFIPHRLTRPGFLKWLKRVHAWTGLWGALLFLLLGTSGFLLNHRQVMKINTGAPVEVSAVAVPVMPGEIRDADGLGRWAKRTFALPVDPVPPKPEGPGSPAQAPKVSFAGRTIAPAVPITAAFNRTDGKLTFEYTPGAAHVTARREAIGLLGTIKNLHKGTGLSVAWILLIDTMAGALITMALTGFLLWSRLHGSRLIAGALAGGSLAWAIAAAAPSLG